MISSTIRFLFVISLLALVNIVKSQTETTFKTNGPDDYREGLHAFIHATIFKNSNTKVENAILVIRDGKITELGTSANIPTGAIVHDLSGKIIYPSFIDIYTDYGINSPKENRSEESIQYESNIKGAYGWNQAIKADFDASKNFLVTDARADEWRKLGFGTVLSHRKDGIARGTGTVVTLATDRENRVILKANASAHYSFSKGSSTQEYPSSLMGTIALLRQTYLDAQWYKNLKEKREYNISLESWNNEQALPQIFEAGSWLRTLRADKVGDEFGVQYIIKGDGTEYRRVEEIKATKAKLILSLNFPKAYDVEDPYKAVWVSLEEMKHWELAPMNLATLSKAGIEFAITTSDLEKKDDFLKNLRTAVKYGLPENEAIKALTETPAALLNIADQVGSLEVGKLANFFISSKNVFDDKSVIYENWVQGKRYEVNKTDPKDIRGEYELKLSNDKVYKLKLTGDSKAPEATVFYTDTAKSKVKFDYKDKEISLSFSKDKNNSEGKIRLTGVIDFEKKSWQGKGQQANGDWINWTAIQIKEAPKDTVKPDKKDSIDFSKIGKVVYPFNAYGSEELSKQEDVFIKNATVWTNEKEGIVPNCDVQIRNGKIVAVGKNLNAENAKIIDGTGKHLTAGIIDEHNHIAISEGVNEGTKASSAEVRIGDVVTSEDVNIYRQLAGGVTAAQLLHGSANPIGGQSALIKFRWGYTPEKMKIEGADGFIKFALGENVKQSNWGEKFSLRYPQTRMGVEQTYVNYFTKAKEYERNLSTKKSLRRDLELETLLEILNKKRFITCHSYVQSEINMLMHVADSFGFKVNTFTHILEGYKVADKMKAHGVNASTFADWWAYKYEVIDAIPYNATILNKMGINTAINSDDAEMARRLNQEAAKSVKYGKTSEEDAWKMVTLNPAKMLHLDAKMGSIKVGKDADVVVWSDHPLSIYAKAEKTFVDGICFYDVEKDSQKRETILRERARLIQKMVDDKKAGAPTQEPVKKDNRSYSCGGEE